MNILRLGTLLFWTLSALFLSLMIGCGTTSENDVAQNEPSAAGRDETKTNADEADESTDPASDSEDDESEEGVLVGTLVDTARILDPSEMTAEQFAQQGQSKMQYGDREGALESFAKAMELEPGDPRWEFAYIQVKEVTALALLKEGEEQRAYELMVEVGQFVRKFLKDNPALERDQRTRDFIAQAFYNEACGYARRKQVEKALSALEEAISAGYSNYHNLRQDEDLAVIREDKRFEAILSQSSPRSVQSAEQTTPSAGLPEAPPPSPSGAENDAEKTEDAAEKPGSPTSQDK